MITNWKYNNLSHLSSFSIAANQLTSFALGSDPRIYCSGADSHLYEFWYNGGNNSWGYNDLTKITTVLTSSILTGFALGSDPRIYCSGADGHLYEIWHNGGNNSWGYNDLTKITSIPAIGMGLTSFAVGSTLHVYLINKGDGHIYELYFDANSWHYNDLTKIASVPVTARGRKLTSFALESNLRVYFIGTDDHVYELCNDGNSWYYNDLTQIASVPVTARGRESDGRSSGLTSFTLGSDLRVYFIGTDDHVYELCYDDNDWYYNDLTQIASVPTAVNAFSGLTSFALEGKPRVYFIGIDDPRDGSGPVYELYFDANSWHYNDLTKTASIPVKTDGTTLTSFALGSTPRIYFVGNDNNVYEIYGMNVNTYNILIQQQGKALYLAVDDLGVPCITTVKNQQAEWFFPYVNTPKMYRIQNFFLGSSKSLQAGLLGKKFYIIMEPTEQSNIPWGLSLDPVPNINEYFTSPEEISGNYYNLSITFDSSNNPELSMLISDTNNPWQKWILVLAE